MITASPVQSQRPPVHLVKWAVSLWYVQEFLSYHLSRARESKNTTTGDAPM